MTSVRRGRARHRGVATGLALGIGVAGCGGPGATPSGMASEDPRFDWFEYEGGDAVFRDSAAAEGEYQNPIIAGFYPDPSVTRAGDGYYLATTSTT